MYDDIPIYMIMLYSSIFNEVGNRMNPSLQKLQSYAKRKKLTSETHVVCLCQSHVMICDDIQLSGKEDSVTAKGT